ncbi:MAG: hypothetical protein HY562_07520 [Ignavibacteriales bacterium]|nr:hypothetical protein [Ignavibacteriales bacterium]
MIRTQCCILLATIGLSVCVFSQQREDPRVSYEDLKREITQLRGQLDSLRTFQILPGSGAGEVSEADLERIDKRMQELEKKIDGLSRSTAPVVFNPRTTIFLNVAGRSDNLSVLDAAGEAKIDNRPFLRTIEMDFRAPVDPYAEAVAIVSIENEAGTGFAVDPEEAYGLLKRLPILESAPLGMKLKIGKFRVPLGVNNRLHMHDLPWTTRPLVISKFLGTEHGEFFESGFNPVGVDIDFFLPNPIPGTTLEMNIDFVKSGDLALSEGHEVNQPAYIGHLNLSRDWENEHLVILGASGYLESGPTSSSLLGLDLTYKWSPSEGRASRSFVVGGEIFFGKHTIEDSLSTQLTTRPYGWFGYLQYQLSYWLYLGSRYDWIQEPTDESLVTKSWSLYASYYTTEFLRFRLGFERRQSDIPGINNMNTILLEVNFVFGSHPTEPYWVNR